MRISSLVVLFVAGALVVACVEPRQYGGPIPVDQAGVEGRLRRLCTVTEQTLGCGAVASEPDADAGDRDSADARSVLDGADAEGPT